MYVTFSVLTSHAQVELLLGTSLSADVIQVPNIKKYQK